jgi:MFS family permease
MIAVLRQRNFLLLWIGGLLSVTGDFLLFIALPFFIYDLTGSVLAAGAMFMAQELPRVLLGSVAGVFVDRWDRKRTMVVADLSRALILLPLLIAATGGPLWPIYAVIFVESTFSIFFLPAQSSIIPSLVEERHLVGANSLISMSQDILGLVGALLGGALLGVVGLSGLILLDVATYLVSVAIISRIRYVRPDSEESTATVPTAAGSRSLAGAFAGVWREWAGGLRAARADRKVATVLAIIAVTMISEGVLGGGAPEFSWIIAGLGLGGIAGSFVVGWLSRFVTATRILAVSLCFKGAILAVIFGIASLPVTLALSPFAGASVVGWYAGGQTLLQTWVSDEYLGRVFGAYEATQGLLLLGGMGLAVALGDLIGIIPLLIAAACLHFSAGLFAWVRLPKTA